MPYSPTTWVDLSTPVDASHMNKIETELVALDSALATVTAGTSGTLASRPAASAASGRFYYATDQAVLYFSDGSAWTRIGIPAGGTTYMFGASAVAPTGWVRYDGGTLAGSTGIYADLYAHLGNSTTLPDTRARMPVDQGTHADVNAIGKNEGVATVANRRPKHRTTNALTGGGQTGTQSANHTHAAPSPWDSNSSGPGPGNAWTGTAGNNSGGVNTGVEAQTHTHTDPAPGGSIGTNVGTDPLDSPAFIVGLLIAKL